MATLYGTTAAGDLQPVQVNSQGQLSVDLEGGEKGPTGDQGPIGEQGPIGDKGPTGDPGEQGPVGDKGPDGNSGVAASSMFGFVAASGGQAQEAFPNDWKRANLNTQVWSNGALVALSENTISLLAGTYIVEAICPFFQTGDSRLMLYGTRSGQQIGNVAIATSNAGADASTSVYVSGVVSVENQEIVELQYFCTANYGSLGRSVSSAAGNKMYQWVRVTPVSDETLRALDVAFRNKSSA